MSDTDTIIALNRLLAVQCRSLPMYLVDASPRVSSGEQKAAEAMESIVADQQAMAARVAAMVTARGGALDTGEFPMEFTDLHFLGFDFLLGEIIRYQHRDIAAVEQIVASVADDPDAHDLAAEALGAERAHLEILEELTASQNQPA